MRTLVVTAADETYMPLLRGLFGSLHQWGARPFTDLACFDVGMTAHGRDWVRRHVSALVAPGWDLPVGAGLRAQRPALRALTVRPFLPGHFPGYDVYLWIDADAWVQERSALEAFFTLAAGGRLVAAPEVDRAYRQRPYLARWRADRLRAYYGDEFASRALWDTYFNAGVFALSAASPFWARWAESFALGLEASDGKLCCDQSALNHAVWTSGLPVLPLPATFNWLCHLALPGYDPARRLLCEPAFPGRPIGIVHLTGGTKDATVVVGGDEAGRSRGLRFEDARTEG